MRWEDMTAMFAASGLRVGGKLDGDAFTAESNEPGVRGWELVSAFDASTSNGQTRGAFAVLKRQAA